MQAKSVVDFSYGLKLYKNWTYQLCCAVPLLRLFFALRKQQLSPHFQITHV